MVKFLNQKEEVLRIELTPYGKQKFSKGEFMPSYYAFYDNDILYDGAYGGVVEAQNSIVTRISTGTPRFGPLVNFSGTINPVATLPSLNSSKDFDQNADYAVPYNRYIGTSSPWSDYAPSWHITVDNKSDVPLTGSTVNYRLDNTVPILKANLLIKYQTEPLENDSLFYYLENNENITLDVQELNTLFKVNGNYDIEVFREDDSNNLHSLQFINPDSEFASNLFYQAEAGTLAETIEGLEEDILNAYPKLDNRYVEYYLDILVDQEIGGIEMPTQSTIYRRNVDRDPGDLCDTVDSIGSALDWGY
jgi:hypothetical protein